MLRPIDQIEGVLTKYGLERELYRIAKSRYRNLFVLKGALLFELWTEQRYRPTRDADFLARGQNDPEQFVTVCARPNGQKSIATNRHQPVNPLAA